MTSCGLI